MRIASLRRVLPGSLRGPSLPRPTGRIIAAHAAWPWFGQPRFPGAARLRAHVEHEDGHRLTPPRGASVPGRPGPATRPERRPTSPAIVRHAGAIWTGTILPSVAF